LVEEDVGGEGAGLGGGIPGVGLLEGVGPADFGVEQRGQAEQEKITDGRSVHGSTEK